MFSGACSPVVAYICTPFAPIAADFLIASIVSNLKESSITPIGN
jgi:hypothetical protein